MIGYNRNCACEICEARGAATIPVRCVEEEPAETVASHEEASDWPGWTVRGTKKEALQEAIATGVGVWQFSEEAASVDMVNSPPHYTAGGIECIEAIRAALTPEEFRGYCKGNALKYVWRERHKGGTESLAKAGWYLDKLKE